MEYGAFSAAATRGLKIIALSGCCFLAFQDESSAQQQSTDVQLDPIHVEGRRARRVAPPAQQQPAQAPVPVQAPERGDGPVDGYVARQSLTGTKTDTPILETPQSISVVTKDQIAAQGAQSLPQALRYVPGIVTEPYGSSTLLEDIKVRGFMVPRYLDGLRLPFDNALGWANTRIETYGLERIEVLRGPSSGLYGQTSPGGLINMVSKRPTATPQREAEFQTGSFGRLQGAFDFSGPIDKERQFLYRLVGLARDTDKVVDFTNERRLFLAPSFTWQPNTDTTFTILGSVQRDRGDGQPHQYLPAYGTLYPNANGRIPYTRNIGEPNYDKWKFDQDLIGYSFEHRFNNVFQFRQNLRYGSVDLTVNSMRNESAFPNISITDRSANYVAASTKNLALDNQLQADFATGPLVHKVLVGFDYQLASQFAEYRNSWPNFFPINIYAPVYGQSLPSNSALSTFLQTKTTPEQLGVYAQDQIKFDRWILTLTGRHDNASAKTTNLLANTVTNQNDKAWTGRAGLTYLFDNGFAPYVSYSTSFEPVAGTDASGTPFKPMTGEGREVGIKYQPAGIKMLFTAALFDITQQNVLTANPANPSFQIQTGEVRVRGYEVEVRASLTDRLDIVGGLSHIEPIVTASNDGSVGKDLPNTPRDTASLWAFYTLRDGPLAGLGFGGGVRYVGDNFMDSANVGNVPSYTLYDAAISYDFAYLRPDLKGLTLQINATNISDRYYVPNCYGLAYCTLGSPRTMLATLRYRW